MNTTGKRTCWATSAMNRTSASMRSRRPDMPFRRRPAASAAAFDGVHFEYSLQDCDCSKAQALSSAGGPQGSFLLKNSFQTHWRFTVGNSFSRWLMSERQERLHVNLVKDCDPRSLLILLLTIPYYYYYPMLSLTPT